MIVVDTTVLVYAVGADHPLAAPCRRFVLAVGDGRLSATTTAEVIQEFVHVRARRRTRRDAAALGRAYLDLFSPLLSVGAPELAEGLKIFERTEGLGAFDAVLAAAAIGSDAEALVSADSSFAHVRRLRFVEAGSEKLDALLG